MTPENLVRGCCQADQDALSFLELGALRGHQPRLMFYPCEVRAFPNRALGQTELREREGGAEGALITLFELLDPAVPELHKPSRLF